MIRRPPLAQFARIDMTPMIGVLTSILIIFIVLTPQYGCGVNVELPQASESLLVESPDNPETLSVGLYHDYVFFRGVRLEDGFDELRRAAHEAHQRKPAKLGSDLFEGGRFDSVRDSQPPHDFVSSGGSQRCPMDCRT